MLRNIELRLNRNLSYTTKGLAVEQYSLYKETTVKPLALYLDSLRFNRNEYTLEGGITIE